MGAKSGGFSAHLRLVRNNVAASLKAAAEYRGNFLLQVFGMVLNNAAFLLFWGFFLEKTGNIGGYGMDQILFLWGMGAGSFGLAHVIFGNVRTVAKMIQTGGLDVYLLQPKNTLLSLLSSRSILSAWGDLPFGLGIFVWLSREQPLLFPLLLLYTVSGAVVFASVFLTSESLAFYWGGSEGLSRTLLELLLTATLYPETIFGPQVRWIFYTLVPAAWIVFVPLRTLSFVDWAYLPMVLAVALSYAAVSVVFFYRGLKRYESGNLMNTRL